MRSRSFAALTAAALLLPAVLLAQPTPLVIAALGNAGARGGILRSQGTLLAQMKSGEHDAGACSFLVLLGDDFGETGLNVPRDQVGGEASATLEYFRPAMEDLGPARFHGIPGETDYYARKAVERTALFGLITIAEWAVGIGERGVQRAAERPEWRFHARVPASVVLPLGGGEADSAEIIFFDSGLLLRTAPSTWAPALDSLRSLLRTSASRPGAPWRIFCSHLPLATVGEHGGYSVWNEEDSTVEYVSGCDRDSNAYRYITNWLTPQDMCTDRYRAYVDSLQAIFLATGVIPQVMLSAHDASLQLLVTDPAVSRARGMVPVQIVAGTGAEAARVALPRPPGVFTASQRGDSGRSRTGFVHLQWREGNLEAVFYNVRNGDRIDMGAGTTVFTIARDGSVRGR